MCSLSLYSTYKCVTCTLLIHRWLITNDSPSGIILRTDDLWDFTFDTESKYQNSLRSIYVSRYQFWQISPKNYLPTFFVSVKKVNFGQKSHFRAQFRKILKGVYSGICKKSLSREAFFKLFWNYPTVFYELPPTKHTKHFKFRGNFSILFQKLKIQYKKSIWGPLKFITTVWEVKNSSNGQLCHEIRLAE